MPVSGADYDAIRISNKKDKIYNPVHITGQPAIIHQLQT
jgi:hypothetical protein